MYPVFGELITPDLNYLRIDRRVKTQGGKFSVSRLCDTLIGLSPVYESGTDSGTQIVLIGGI